MIRLFIFFICFTTFASCTSQDVTYGAKEFSEKVKSEKAKNLIDVRTPEEFKEGFIEGAKKTPELIRSFCFSYFLAFSSA